MMARRIALVLAIGMMVAGVTRGDDEKAGDDLKKMQGTWVRAGDDGPDLRWVFKGDALEANVDDSKYNCTVTVDPKATPARSIDLLIKDGPGDTAGKTAKGIYNFEKNNLVVCISHPGGDRPSDFKPVDDKSFVFVLKPEK